MNVSTSTNPNIGNSTYYLGTVYMSAVANIIKKNSECFSIFFQELIYKTRIGNAITVFCIL